MCAKVFLLERKQSLGSKQKHIFVVQSYQGDAIPIHCNCKRYHYGATKSYICFKKWMDGN